MQSEVEGVDNENIGFYGICVLHATRPMCESDHDPVNTEVGCIEEEELTCARTEVFDLSLRLFCSVIFLCRYCMCEGVTGLPAVKAFILCFF